MSKMRYRSQNKQFLVLLRHGQSQWNLEHRFTGWFDSPLTQEGEKEAKNAGKILKDLNIIPDATFTSVQKRAIKTSWLTLEEMGLEWIPQYKHWRLNERHYGTLTGLNKNEIIKEYGFQQVYEWRRGYDNPPPPMLETDFQYATIYDNRYADIPREDLPRGESLKMTLDRVLPYWNECINPELEKGNNVLVVAHGNLLRSLIKHLEDIPDNDIAQLVIPTGKPFVYDLSAK